MATPQLRFAPECQPDPDDVVQLYVLDIGAGRSEVIQARCQQNGDWQALPAGDVIDASSRRMIIGWSPVSAPQSVKYATRF